MTQQTLDNMKAADGIYMLGWKAVPGLTHLVATMSGTIRQVVVSHNELDPTPETWNELELVAGPLTVQRMRDLNEKAQQVEELVLTLQHDLEVWHQRALTAEAKLQRMKK